MLITREYRELNTELHEQQIGYGSNGWQWIGPIIHFARRYRAKTILDYGAGKGTLAAWMPPEYSVVSYDPVTFPDDPPPQDFLVCLDVMEHIEPDCLNDVLRHMRQKTKRAGFLVISTREAHKTLSDGRNAHLIVKDKDFWAGKLKTHFRHIEQVKNLGRGDELVLVVAP